MFASVLCLVVYVLVLEKGATFKNVRKKVVYAPNLLQHRKGSLQMYVPLCIPKSLKVTPRRLLAPRVLIDLRAS